MQSKIVVKGGIVQSVEEWTTWNGLPSNTLSIERTRSGFKSAISNPGHGGSSREGKTLQQVLRGIHPEIQAKFQRLFDMRDVTSASLATEFSGYAVEIS